MKLVEITKDEFKGKLDGSYERKLRAAYFSGYDDGFDAGAYQEGGGPVISDASIEGQYQDWLKDVTRHKV